jgi:2'-5' RNA ligase
LCNFLKGIFNAMRLFVAIWPPAEVLEQLEPAIQRLQTDIGRQGVRFTKPEKIHLTMRFLGEVDEKQLDRLTDSLTANLQGISVGELQVQGIGAFPDSRRPGIVWAGLVGELTALHQRILEATDDFAERPDSKPFHPHLTLARVSPPSQKVGRALDPIVKEWGAITLATWEPEEVSLVQTLPGGSYAQLASFPLEPAR